MTNYKKGRGADLEDQQVQQDVEGARGGGRRAACSLPLSHDKGQVSHLFLTRVNELHLAAVDQLVVLHLSCRSRQKQ